MPLPIRYSQRGTFSLYTHTDDREMKSMSKRIGVMEAKPFEERLIKRWERIIVQPKINGLRCRAVRTPSGEWVLYSSQANVFRSVPHINRALQELQGGPDVLDGELYIHGESFQNICSLVKRDNLHPNHERVEYHVFDSIDLYKLQMDRLWNIITYLPRSKSIVLVLSDNVDNKPDNIRRYLDEYMSVGYEGIILRNPKGLYDLRRSSNLIKLKPTKQDTYPIICGFEAISQEGVFKNMLGGLVLQDKDGNAFKCGAGCFTHDERRSIWADRESLHNKIATIKYPALSDGGIPLQSVLILIEEKKDESDNKDSTPTPV